MNHIEAGREGVGPDGKVGGDVARAQLAAHARAQQTERQVRLQRGQAGLRQPIPGDGIAHHADQVAAPRLLGAEIADMPEKAADGSAQAMQDAIGPTRAEARAPPLRASARRRRSCRRGERCNPVVHPSSLRFRPRGGG